MAAAPDPDPAMLGFHGVVSGRRRGLTTVLARGGLWVLAGPYGLAMRLRNLGYARGWRKVHRATVPVVSIGNLTLGGTGKTPAVEYVARRYREQEVQVAILSRGYGSERGRNDEALVLEANLPDVPHLQGRDRVALARLAVEELESELLLLDDGFQHRRLHRDLDVVLVDATNPWGHGHVFPRGLLREPRSGLRRADVVVLTRCDQVGAEALARLRGDVDRLAPGKPVVEAVHVPLRLLNGEGVEEELAYLRQRPAAGFCGLGNPASFRASLQRLAGTMTDFRVFPDHHPYTREDVDALRHWARRQPSDAVLVTTQKDLVKLAVTQLGGRPLWALRVAFQPTRGQEQLDLLLKGVMA